MKQDKERAQSATAHKKKSIYHLHNELGHLSEVITGAMAKPMGIQVTSTFRMLQL